MRMSHATMYGRLLAGDAAYNGRFFTGVLTTGIYCLPSCKARKPKPQNVRFFPTCENARAAGFRACRKCHPDDFARGADPVLDDIETLVGEIRHDPAAFPDVRAIVRRSGFGATRLFELLRLHYHATPADLLVRARIAAAKRVLLSGPDHARSSILELANATGFASASVFHEHFRRLTGLTPAAYRELRDASAFSVALPAGYPLGYLRRALGRDAHSVTESLLGDHYTAGIRLPSGEPAVLELELVPDTVRARVSRTGAAPDAHDIVVGLLGLDQDAGAFSRLARKLGFARLVAGRSELRVAQTPSIFDGVVWSIIGQQINFAFACQLRRRLVELAGTRLTDRVFAPPTPQAVARLEPADLLPLKFSRQKADYLISTAKLIATGQLDLTAMRGMSATRAERTLLALRGLGPWSVHYLMMRSLGFPDCVPLGDTGVTSGLQALMNLTERPGIDATRRLMAIFSPHRSLATAHLWQLNQPIPA